MGVECFFLSWAPAYANEILQPLAYLITIVFNLLVTLPPHLLQQTFKQEIPGIHCLFFLPVNSNSIQTFCSKINSTHRYYYIVKEYGSLIQTKKLKYM